jgi:hypothetical protein
MAPDRDEGLVETMIIIEEIQYKPGFQFSDFKMVEIKGKPFHHLIIWKGDEKLEPIKIPSTRIDECPQAAKARTWMKQYLMKAIWKRLHER